MKYSVLDFISCPVDQHFPLKLSAAEVTDAGAAGPPPPACEQYCGYREVSLGGAVSSSLNCEQCRSKTIEEGVLSCEHCGALYLITRGIPQLIPEELKSPAETQLLRDFRSQSGLPGRTADSQAIDNFILQAKRNEMGSRGKYNKDEIIAGYALKRFDFINRIQFEAVARYLQVNQSDIVLDAGAGYGTCSVPISQRCRYVVATDITFEVLQAFKEFFYGLPTSYFKGYSEFPENRICLIQADMCHPPFRTGFNFTKAISSQVVCHIPGEKERRSFIEGIAHHLAPGGTFVLTAFNYSLFRRLLRLFNKTPKEAILRPTEWTGYYYRFTEDEFRKLLNDSFVVRKLFGFQSIPSRYLALVNTGTANLLERAIQALPFSCLGEILLAECHKRA